MSLPRGFYKNELQVHVNFAAGLFQGNVILATIRLCHGEEEPGCVDARPRSRENSPAERYGDSVTGRIILQELNWIEEYNEVR